MCETQSFMCNISVAYEIFVNFTSLNHPISNAKRLVGQFVSLFFIRFFTAWRSIYRVVANGQIIDTYSDYIVNENPQNVIKIVINRIRSEIFDAEPTQETAQ